MIDIRDVINKLDNINGDSITKAVAKLFSDELKTYAAETMCNSISDKEFIALIDTTVTKAGYYHSLFHSMYSNIPAEFGYRQCVTEIISEIGIDI